MAPSLNKGFRSSIEPLINTNNGISEKKAPPSARFLMNVRVRIRVLHALENLRDNVFKWCAHED